MLQKQRSLCLASQKTATTRVGIAMLGGAGYFPSSPSWNLDREGSG